MFCYIGQTIRYLEVVAIDSKVKKFMRHLSVERQMYLIIWYSVVKTEYHLLGTFDVPIRSKPACLLSAGSRAGFPCRQTIGIKLGSLPEVGLCAHPQPRLGGAIF